jgi:AAA domain
LICAGEKDAETAASLGFVATTNPEGERKGAWVGELNAWFVGRKRVAVMEDNDQTGREHAIEVAGAMRNAGVPDVRIVTFREMPEHGDITDWIELGHGAKDLQARIEGAGPAISPLHFIDTSRWDFEDAPEQEWSVYNRIPRRECILFSGEGGAGKSILQLQQCCASTIEREWLGVVPERGPAIFIDAEDDKKVLHRRTKAISEHYGVSVAEMARNGLHLVSWRGMDATLAVPERSGKMEPTPLYRQLLEAAGDIKPIMIGIAASANVFAGKTTGHKCSNL